MSGRARVRICRLFAILLYSLLAYTEGALDRQHWPETLVSYRREIGCVGRKQQVRKQFFSPALRGTVSTQQVSEEGISLCVPLLSPGNLWLQWTWMPSISALPERLNHSHYQAPPSLTPKP